MKGRATPRFGCAFLSILQIGARYEGVLLLLLVQRGIELRARMLCNCLHICTLCNFSEEVTNDVIACNDAPLRCVRRELGVLDNGGRDVRTLLGVTRGPSGLGDHGLELLGEDHFKGLLGQFRILRV